MSKSSKPRILVLTAAGKTGLPTAQYLLGEGFPVTAFVRREDRRSERLRAAGAEIIAGSLTDIATMRKAFKGVQRAYFCTPLAEGNLKTTAVFAAVAAEQRQPLESIVAMSQWLSSPQHPSAHTRETWLSDRLLAQIPGTALTLLNPGYFADNDMQVLPFAAQFGLMMAPYGAGRNAAPSNEDIARVGAAVLARPEGHAGKTYRPTGPALLTPQDIAAVFARVLGRKVTYVTIPIWLFSKVAKGMGFSDYAMAQNEKYLLDYQQDAFAVNAPTTVVRDITGSEPEAYEQIVRRYVSARPEARRSFATQVRFMAQLNGWMLLPAPNRRYLATGDFSSEKQANLSANSPEWRRSHEFTPSIKGVRA